MRFHTIEPKCFVIRSDAELVSLQRLLPKMGLTLKPLSLNEAIKLCEEESDHKDSQTTEPYSSDESADDLSDHCPTKGSNPMA